MIQKSEIVRAGVDLGVNASDVQRDYIFGWLLCGLYSCSPLGDRLVLKGGNCLRKAYFPFGRFSGDLDFSAADRIPTEWLRTELNKICDFINAATGVIFDTSRTVSREKRGADEEMQIVEARLYFSDFHGRESSTTISVRVDITEFDRLHLPVQKRQLIHAYSDSDKCKTEIRCVKLEEQLASKMKCLLQRRHVADLFDLTYHSVIHPEFEVNRAEVVATFLRKTIFSRSPGIAKGLLLDLPLAIFKGYWEKYIVCPRQSEVDFGRASSAFVDFINWLFSSIAASQQRAEYFPASLRNPIMEAGHSMTLLNVVYDGVARAVEPYALSYKVRKDGFAREYFYVYDRTGGRSGPSLKSFVASKVHSISNTTEKFTPRYPVEIMKAGEVSGSLYFQGKASPGYSSRAASVKYVLECGICGRQFGRKQYNMSLRPHKDDYGNRCVGRYGSIV